MQFTYFLEYYSVDYAGNYEEIKNATIVVEDIHSPYRPTGPDGVTSGKINREYTYTASTTDLDDDQIYYVFNWGDGSISEWLGPYNSGDTIHESHTWNSWGRYPVKVKCKDTYDVEGDWSDPLIVTMPKSKGIFLFNSFFQNHPNLSLLLRYLMNIDIMGDNV